MRRACRFKSCHPYQRCDANCCIAFFVSRNRNYVAPLVGSSAALGFLKCYALDSPSACGHPYHENDSASCYFFAVEGVPFPTHHENSSISCYFFYASRDFCNRVATTLCVANPGTPGRCSLLHLKLEVTVNYVFFKNRLPNARGGVTIRYI